MQLRGSSSNAARIFSPLFKFGACSGTQPPVTLVCVAISWTNAQQRPRPLRIESDRWRRIAADARQMLELQLDVNNGITSCYPPHQAHLSA